MPSNDSVTLARGQSSGRLSSWRVCNLLSCLCCCRELLQGFVGFLEEIQVMIAVCDTASLLVANLRSARFVLSACLAFGNYNACFRCFKHLKLSLKKKQLSIPWLIKEWHYQAIIVCKLWHNHKKPHDDIR